MRLQLGDFPAHRRQRDAKLAPGRREAARVDRFNQHRHRRKPIHGNLPKNERRSLIDTGCRLKVEGGISAALGRCGPKRRTRPMLRIPTPASIEAAPAASQPLLQAVKALLGVVPNLFRLVATSPAALEGY